jgi:low temperature requirement protein LtrA
MDFLSSRYHSNKAHLATRCLLIIIIIIIIITIVSFSFDNKNNNILQLGTTLNNEASVL